MDLICVKCGEPVETEELHDIPGMTFRAAYRAFVKRGCAGIGFECNPEGSPRPDAAEVYALLGDDVDGAASELEMLRFSGEW